MISMDRAAQDGSLQVRGPAFKPKNQYLSSDGDNPEAPWPGYGWPLGTECWYFVLSTPLGARRFATGSTVERAWERAVTLTQTMADA